MINLPTRVFDPFKNLTVGFDDIFDQLSSMSKYVNDIPNYPPYNIKKVGKDKYQLDMALAGFSKDDVKVEVKENTLTVSASSSDKEDDSYVHKGIAKRAFKRSWTLVEHLEVQDAKLKDGVLTVDMKLNLPEEKKPKTITIK
jgi:molecular chaperone IbpA|tara:strand:- start:197 stop:622 length:426 start_codon:yes stop_codon:yes gene_type:complete